MGSSTPRCLRAPHDASEVVGVLVWRQYQLVQRVSLSLGLVLVVNSQVRCTNAVGSQGMGAFGDGSEFW